MRLMWQQHLQEYDWRFILIGAHNSFNEENQAVILWAVRHNRPSGAYFTFKCCHHWATLVIRDGEDMGHLFYRN